jgi:hypothetical protein
MMQGRPSWGRMDLHHGHSAAGQDNSSPAMVVPNGERAGGEEGEYNYVSILSQLTVTVTVTLVSRALHSYDYFSSGSTSNCSNFKPTRTGVGSCRCTVVVAGH